MTATETTPAVIDKPTHQVVTDTGPFANWLDSNKYNHLWRAAQMLASSDLVPDHFKNKPANCFIATQMAIRLGVERQLAAPHRPDAELPGMSLDDSHDPSRGADGHDDSG